MSLLRVLALDFDGVIWDSAGECFEIGWRVYQGLTGQDLSGAQNRARFVAARPLARTGHDFFLILRLMHTRPELDLPGFPLAEFVKLRSELADEAAVFNRDFYALRAKYREQSFEQWASWQGPYPEMLGLLDRWEARFRGTALATTKDAASAHALLQSVGRDWPVFGKEFSVDKDRQIAGIARQFDVSVGEVLFVDDLLENLHQVAPLGTRTAMAAWGYNTEQSREEARLLGFRVVDVEGLETMLQETFGEVRA